jgi:hypothetical protein
LGVLFCVFTSAFICMQTFAAYLPGVFPRIAPLALLSRFNAN